MTTKRRSHKNTRRLTAKERARLLVKALLGSELDLTPINVDIAMEALQAHAGEAVARYKRRVVTVTYGPSLTFGRDTGERVTVTGMGVGRKRKAKR